MPHHNLRASDRSVRPAKLTPNLIMPGVAKCGTTTLYHLLTRHPEITGGLQKEVRFLLDVGEDLFQPENIHNRGLGGWIERYPDRGRGPYSYWIDASPQYQYQATAYEVIAGVEDKPRLIFIVRRPSRRLFSMYRYLRYQTDELPHINSFARFIDEIRPPNASQVGNRMLANAMADSRYDEMLERWSAILPRGNIWVTSIEALGTDQNGVLADLCEWLGIDAAPLLDLQPVRSNPTVRIRSQALLKADNWLAQRLPQQGILRRAKNWAHNLIGAPLPPHELAENADFLARLDEEFAPNVERFNALAAAMQPGFRPLPVQSPARESI